MPEAKKLTPADVLKGESPLVLTATLEPIGSDRFQPAGFPEIGHVIYKAPRKDGTTEPVCIVDSAASMAWTSAKRCHLSMPGQLAATRQTTPAPSSTAANATAARARKARQPS